MITIRFEKHCLVSAVGLLLLPVIALESAAGQESPPPVAACQPASLEDLRAMLANRSRPLTWVFTGDSITHGAKHTAGCRSYPEHFAERVRWELGRGQDIVINTGLSGDRAEGLLRNFEWRVARFKPDVVSIMIGMNDCTGGPAKRELFRAQLRELIQRTCRLGAAPLLHTQNPIESAGPGAPERADVAAYAGIVREVAHEQRVALVDHWEYWRTNCASPAALAAWLNDPIHPNARGHREMAILTFKTLGIFSTNSSFAAPWRADQAASARSTNATSAQTPLKPARAGVSIAQQATDMPGLKMGPFVRLGDRRLLCLQGTNGWFSADEGATWQARPLFAEPAKFRIAESTLLRTSKGVLLAAFLNMAEAHWTWDKKLCDAPGATLPTYVLRSLDDGATWEPPQQLHDEWTGSNRDMKELGAGRVIFTSMKLAHNPGRHTVLTYCSDDQGQTWKASNVIDLGDIGNHGGVTEATIEELKGGRLLMLLRSNWMRFWEAESTDGGLHWHPLGPSDLPASSAPGTLRRLASDRIVLVWNRPFPEGQDSFPLMGGDRQWSAKPVSNHRAELSLAFSDDECRTWSAPVVIARKPGQWLAYPFVFEPAPGELWITTMQGGVRLKLREADFCAARAGN